MSDRVNDIMKLVVDYATAHADWCAGVEHEEPTDKRKAVRAAIVDLLAERNSAEDCAIALYLSLKSIKKRTTSYGVRWLMIYLSMVFIGHEKTLARAIRRSREDDRKSRND